MKVHIPKFYFTLLFCCCLSFALFAGKNRGKVVMTGRPGSLIYIGGGANLPMGATKNTTYLTNSGALAFDAFLPFVQRSAFSFGLNLGGSFSFDFGKPGYPLPAAYNVAGQTSSTVAYRGVDPKSPGFKTLLGPQFNIHIGDKFMISPIFAVGFMAHTQNEVSAVQTTQYNGQSYDFKLLTFNKSTSSGFCLSPKLRLSYMFHEHVGLWAEANYAWSPSVSQNVTTMKQPGSPDANGNYAFTELQLATYKQQPVVSAPYHAFGANVGLVFSFGKKCDNQPEGSIAQRMDDKSKGKSKNNFIEQGNAEEGDKGDEGKIAGAGIVCACCGVVANYAHENQCCGIITNSGNNGTPVVLSMSALLCHNKINNYCDDGGVMCIEKPSNAQSLNKDEVQLNTSIVLEKGNHITIYAIGKESNISAESMAKFVANNVTVKPTEIPAELVEKLLKSINLKSNGKPLIFATNEITYNIEKDKNNKPIIIIKQHTKMEIEGKPYRVTAVVTTGTISSIVVCPPGYHNYHGECIEDGDGPGDVVKGWNGKANVKDMPVLKKTNSTKSQVETMTIKGNGETTANGTPIIYGKTVSGTIQMQKGASNKNIAVKIEQKESGDQASTLTDENGNFSMTLGYDTLHIVSVNGVEYGTIKIIDNTTDNSTRNSDDIRKGWNGKVNVSAQTVALPNGMGLGYQTTSAIVVNGSQKVTYTDLTEQEAATISDKLVTFTLPSELSILNKEQTALDKTSSTPVFYWKVYKGDNGRYIATPMPLMLTNAGNGQLADALQKPGGSGGCFQYQFLQPDVPTLTTENNEEELTMCPANMMPPGGVDLASGIDMGIPGTVVYNTASAAIKIVATPLAKPLIIQQNNFCSQYIKGYGMVVFPKDFKAGCNVAGAMVTGLFQGGTPVKTDKQIEGMPYSHLGHLKWKITK